MEFYELEDTNATRFSWNSWPSTRVEAERVVVPLATVYTPLRAIPDLTTLYTHPIRCKSTGCEAVLNPYCQVDFMNKYWVCPFCLTRNHFPAEYHDISPDSLKPELFQQSSTIEYILPEVKPPPLFLFIIDTCTIESELNQIKSSLLQSIGLLPENALVGLITFGTHTHVHELGFADCPKAFVFRGDVKEDSTDTLKIQDLLGIGKKGENATNLNNSSFLLPISDCEFVLTSILEELSPDPWAVSNAERPKRCTGVALGIGISILEAFAHGQSARLMLFAAGPPTVGPGSVVPIDLKSTIRSHHDLYKGNAPLFNKAVKFYEALASKAVENSHVIDIFACSLDQVGVAEMRVLVQRTGGSLILSDLADSRSFKESFQKVFRRNSNGDMCMTFDGRIDVLTSREFKVCGAIGALSSLKVKHGSVSDKEIGIGGTRSWALGGMDETASIAFYYDVVNKQASKIPEGSFGYLQFLTRYRTASGQTCIRVTTLAIPFVDSSQQSGLNQLRLGFDQEASACIVARLAVYKADTEFALEVLRWIDRSLIKLVSKFADYTPEQPDTFSLSSEFSFYPQFMFNLRRSHFLQVFNSSPDETAFYRFTLLKENVTNALIMIQPTLMAYTLEGAPEPALLDIASMENQEQILLLDTYFTTVIWHGDAIAQWRNDGLHFDPEYAYFAEFLEAAKSDAEVLINNRFPTPTLVVCDKADSQSRYIRARLNPSKTHNSPYASSGPIATTEDVGLGVFMEHLRKLAVAKE